jgi:predicted transcriptional regulator
MPQINTTDDNIDLSCYSQNALRSAFMCSLNPSIADAQVINYFLENIGKFDIEELEKIVNSASKWR